MGNAVTARRRRQRPVLENCRPEALLNDHHLLYQ